VQLTAGTIHEAWADVKDEPCTAYPLQLVLSAVPSKWSSRFRIGPSWRGAIFSVLETCPNAGRKANAPSIAKRVQFIFIWNPLYGKYL
jgi:hypothetical protein